jgi:hypothetical protein
MRPLGELRRVMGVGSRAAVPAVPAVSTVSALPAVPALSAIPAQQLLRTALCAAVRAQGPWRNAAVGQQREHDAARTVEHVRASGLQLEQSNSAAVQQFECAGAFEQQPVLELTHQRVLTLGRKLPVLQQHIQHIVAGIEQLPIFKQQPGQQFEPGSFIELQQLFELEQPIEFQQFVEPEQFELEQLIELQQQIVEIELQ